MIDSIVGIRFVLVIEGGVGRTVGGVVVVVVVVVVVPKAVVSLMYESAVSLSVVDRVPEGDDGGEKAPVLLGINITKEATSVTAVLIRIDIILLLSLLWWFIIYL